MKNALNYYRKQLDEIRAHLNDVDYDAAAGLSKLDNQI